jgi:urease accessory protein
LALAELASALRPTAEFALESGQQGSSFLSTVRAAWPHPRLHEIAALLARRGLEPALPIAVGIAAAVHRIPPELLLAPYLQAFAANIVSAGARLVPLGQTECQRVIAELQPLLPDLAEEILSTDADDVGGCVPVVEWCSMRHETQYTRLFRS